MAVVTVGSKLTVETTGFSPSLVSATVTTVGSRSVVVVFNTEQVCAPSDVELFRNVVLVKVHLVVTVVLMLGVVVILFLVSLPPPAFTATQSV